MQLSRFSDLALRSLMVLAIDAGETEQLMTASVVATKVNASTGHIAKAISRLVELGLVTSRRGRGGGVQITNFGATASIGSILREFEGDSEVIECEGSKPCPLAAACQLRRELARAQEAFFAALDPLTIAELTAPPARGVLLQLSVAAL